MRVLRCFAGLYTRKRIPQAAAALSYYLTMSSFPLIICLYSLLGNNYAKALRILEFLDEFFSAETTRMLKSFFSYVAMSHSTPMLIAGITVLLTTASAASRSLQSTIGKLQGGRRYRGFRYFLFSLVFSLAFLAAMYFAIVVMFTGQKFIELINGYLKTVYGAAWSYVREYIDNTDELSSRNHWWTYLGDGDMWYDIRIIVERLVIIKECAIIIPSKNVGLDGR